MIRIHEILDKLSAYMTQAELDLVRKAYVFSASAHAGQTRLSGEPYLSHPLEVANILADMQLDAASVAAGLLHDTVEDTKATVDEIEAEFGEEVADLVDGVTKISLMSFETKEHAQAENIRKMILAMAENIRVLLVKLADRLHNMRTLDFQKQEKQRLISQETLEIYAQLANRLGLHRLKSELEDLSLKYLKPDVYNQITDSLKNQVVVGQEYIDTVMGILGSICEENSIKARITGRTKHVYSIYQKMLKQGLSVDQICDLIAFRVIITGGIKECYAMLGLVHAMWKPVPGRFKDYVSMPKANMYQSLHTTVIGPEGERIEIQMRTEEMHKLAEFGVAAHWRYKDKGKSSSQEADRFTWLRQILDWQREMHNPREFLTSLKSALHQEEVYVFTPKGEVKELPEGATPVDFAYQIHSQVGDRCAGAKVNGRLVPLTTALKNGDTVEIITSPQRTPSRDWLEFVKTPKARTRIKHFVRTEERARSIALAREMLEKEGRKLGVNFAKTLKDGSFAAIAKEFSFTEVDEFLSAIGYAKVPPKRVLRRLAPELAPEKGEKVEKAEKPSDKPAEKAAERREAVHPEKEHKAAAEGGARIRGVDDVLIRYAGCCDPLPGEPIVGYVSRGKGYTVHTATCPNLLGLESERLMSLSWENSQHKPYPGRVRIVTQNVKGVLAKVSGVLADMDVNIDAGAIKSTVDGNAEINLTVEVKDAAHLYKAIDVIRRLDFVREVVRVSGGHG